MIFNQDEVKVYLAGSCSKDKRVLMESIAKMLRTKEGVSVYAPFELKIPNAWDYSQEDWARLVFIADKEAIDNADAVIIISEGRISTAGTNWEQGYAYGLNKHVIVFQTTEEQTSLMTFCGCEQFVNTTKDDLLNDISSYMDIFLREHTFKTDLTVSKTVLT